MVGSEEVLVDTVSCPLSSKTLDGGGVSSSLPNNNQGRADRKQEVAETIQRHSSAADGGNGPAYRVFPHQARKSFSHTSPRWRGLRVCTSTTVWPQEIPSSFTAEVKRSQKWSRFCSRSTSCRNLNDTGIYLIPLQTKTTSHTGARLRDWMDLDKRVQLNFTLGQNLLQHQFFKHTRCNEGTCPSRGAAASQMPLSIQMFVKLLTDPNRDREHLSSPQTQTWTSFCWGSLWGTSRPSGHGPDETNHKDWVTSSVLLITHISIAFF